MHYYEHHIGDYAQATAHLGFVEDAAYSRLIRKYYAEERPLPPDIKAVQRLVGARTKEERQAVVTVLHEFFELREDGWHNKRCDEEIRKYRDKQQKARASADARWAKRNANAMRTHTETDANALRTQCEGNAHHTPNTIHQTPEELTAITSQAAANKVHVLHNAAAEKTTHTRAIEIAVMLRQRGAALQASDPRVIAWAEEGFTDAQVLSALETAQQRRHEQGNPQPINAGYIDAILRATVNAANHQPSRRRSIHDERAEVIAALTGRNRETCRTIDITPTVAYSVG